MTRENSLFIKSMLFTWPVFGLIPNLENLLNIQLLMYSSFEILRLVTTTVMTDVQCENFIS